VTNRSHVYVGLGPIELLFGHQTLLSGTRAKRTIRKA